MHDSRTYRYSFEGNAADGQTWSTNGTVLDEDNNIADVFNRAMQLSFDQMTGGKAVYGKPGEGCRGPYTIKRILIERIDQ